MTDQRLAVREGQTLLARLPKLTDNAAQVSRLVTSWDEASTPVGMGKYGELLDWGDGVPTNLIWHDPDLYCFGTDDPVMVAPGEALDNLLFSYQQRQVKDENQIARTTLVAPLILVERANPQNPRQKLLLLWKLQPWVAARHLKWAKIPALVYPDIPNYLIRNWGLHLRIQESPPSKAEIWRQVRAIYEESPESMPDTQEGIARLLGMSREYISKLESIAERSQEADLAWRQGQIAVSTAIKLCEALGNYPSVLQRTLTHLIEQPMNTVESERYIMEAKREATQVLQLPSDKPRAGKGDAKAVDYLDKFKTHLGVALQLLESKRETFTTHLGEDTADDFAKQLATMIKLINTRSGGS
jgi:transcriptional regulator with XRE-family HTH domain